MDQALIGQTGIIRTVSNQMCSVYLPVEDRSVSVDSEHLEPVYPAMGEEFKAISGEHREAVGRVHTIDDGKAICSLNNGAVYISLKELCKLATS